MITKDMGIRDIVMKYPQTVVVFQSHGMGCLGCSAARFENLAQGAAAHGIDIDKLVQDLNDAIAEK